jgi:histone-binding protein RBBP4
MVWQPTMRVWAGDEVKIDERELEGDAMDVEMTAEAAGPSGQTEDEKMGDAAEQEDREKAQEDTTEDKGKSAASGSGTQSMSVSAAASVSGADD